jgi:hypothetical protein
MKHEPAGSEVNRLKCSTFPDGEVMSTASFLHLSPVVPAAVNGGTLSQKTMSTGSDEPSPQGLGVAVTYINVGMVHAGVCALVAGKVMSVAVIVNIRNKAIAAAVVLLLENCILFSSPLFYSFHILT